MTGDAQRHVAQQHGLVLVTGAVRGFGAVVARQLAATGHRVAVLGRNPVAVTRMATQIDAVPVVADVTDRAEVSSAAKKLLGRHGPVSTLINNAAQLGPLGPVWQVDPQAWWYAMEVNIGGTHNVTSAILPHMIESGSGRVINVVSHAGVARWPHGSAYSVSKAAVIKYGENLAAEVRRMGIAVLSYHPGILEIGMTADLLAAELDPEGPAAMIANWFRRQIHEGRSVDVAGAAALLVRIADGAADALSGRYLTAHDDLDQLIADADRIHRSSSYTLGLLPPA